MPENKIIQKLTHYYHIYRPDLIDPQVKLDWVNTSGWESEIYAFTLTSGKAEQRHSEQRVLRLLTGGKMADAAREYQIMELLGKAGYPVPEVYALGNEKHGFGRPFIIMQCIKGDSFADRFQNSLANNSFPLQQFISLLHQLHALNWHPYVANPNSYEHPDDPYYHFDRVLAQYDYYLSQAGLSAFDPVMAWLKEQRHRTACPRSSIVHLDFHHNNILQDLQGNLYVIDWTSAEISDYRFDLAWTLTLALAYRGPAGRQTILEAYEKDLEQPVPELDVFEVAAILRRIGSVLISIHAGAEALGMRPEAIRAMQGEAEPLTRLYTHLCQLIGDEQPEILALITRIG